MARGATPQDRKARSLARDRRNSYEENDKPSRTAICSRKRRVNRVARQASRQALHDGLTAPGDAPRTTCSGSFKGSFVAWHERRAVSSRSRGDRA